MLARRDQLYSLPPAPQPYEGKTLKNLVAAHTMA